MTALARTADPVRVSGFPASDGTASLAGCFGLFLRRAVPSHAAYSVARGICDDVIAACRAAFPHSGNAADHVVAGAVGKRTALAPIKVIDVLYLLPPQTMRPHRAADALKIVAAPLAKSFAGVSMSATGVLIPRGPHWVKVIPTLPHKGAFLIPGAATLTHASGWCVSNPVAEAATLRLSDSLYGGRPRLLLTALKAWREAAQVPIATFALELLAQEFYASAPRPFELDRAMVDFWAWARTRHTSNILPPGVATPMDVGIAWHGKAKAAYWRATLGAHHIQTEKLIEAAVEWRQLLGPLFPLPGETPLKALPLFKKQKAE